MKAKVNPLYIIAFVLFILLGKVYLNYIALPEKPICLNSPDRISGTDRYLTYYVTCHKRE